MTNLIKAAEMALEVLEEVEQAFGGGSEWFKERFEALRQALAQPEQAPVAWMDIDEKGAMSGLRYWHEPENRHEMPLYTTPPQRTWVGLTDEEIDLIDDANWEDAPRAWGIREFARAIEAKLKEKNNG